MKEAEQKKQEVASTSEKVAAKKEETTLLGRSIDTVKTHISRLWGEWENFATSLDVHARGSSNNCLLE
jgi:hypothetical protein